jgi:hypothetical protein
MFEKSQGEHEKISLQYGQIERGGTRLRYDSWVGKEIAFVTVHTSFIGNDEQTQLFDKHSVDVAYKKGDADIGTE